MARAAEPKAERKIPAPDARAVLFALALEEEDRGGRLVAIEERRRATKEAIEGDKKPDKGRWLAPRAHDLVEVFGRDRPWVERLLRLADPGRGYTTPIVLGAFVLGLMANSLDVGRLSHERMLDVLAPPLLVLIAWNLAIYVLMVVRLVLPKGPDPGALGSRLAAWLERPVRRLADWVWKPQSSRRRWRGGEEESEDPDGPLQEAVVRRFVREWLPASTPLASARARRMLHLASLATVLGVIAGMYARGLVLEYRATWESTFLDPGQVDALLHTVLTPAATVLDMEIPLASAIESSQVRLVAGSAAPWIHLWAMTCLLFVGIPRAALAAWETARLWAAQSRLPIALPAAYLRRLRAAVATTAHDIQVVPYSHRPTEKAIQTLRGLLLDLMGARSEVRSTETLEYGAGAPEPFAGRLRVALYTLVQTPEAEVHGDLLRALVDDRVDGQGLLMVVDESSFRKRATVEGAALEERLESRRRAWRRVAGDVDIDPVFVDLGQESDPDWADAVAGRLRAATWPKDLAWGAPS